MEKLCTKAQNKKKVRFGTEAKIALSPYESLSLCIPPNRHQTLLSPAKKGAGLTVNLAEVNRVETKLSNKVPQGMAQIQLHFHGKSASTIAKWNVTSSSNLTQRSNFKKIIIHFLEYRDNKIPVRQHWILRQILQAGSTGD